MSDLSLFLPPHDRSLRVHFFTDDRAERRVGILIVRTCADYAEGPAPTGTGGLSNPGTPRIHAFAGGPQREASLLWIHGTIHTKMREAKCVGGEGEGRRGERPEECGEETVPGLLSSGLATKPTPRIPPSHRDHFLPRRGQLLPPLSV
ncbi:hypothetical protein EYF80_052399 [Liparis tanakae]|uniref:Uncharacterized protein n=1 Tax=Liparis tanakae TaxID=230148 RepID=A0A4Z2F885_9TELE|nr:hypothetical protein EYF80_052399 [Liparis tanakae]